MGYENWKQKAWKSYIDRISRHMNVELLGCLGEGTWGVAYEIPGNRVLKITEHDVEINNAIKLKGRKNNYLADIYDVYLPDIYPAGIIVEKLTPIPSEYFSSFDAAHKDAYGQYTEWYKEAREGFDEMTYKYFAGKDAGDVYVGLINIFNEARFKGITIWDIHCGNLGLKNGRMALFDIA